TGDWRMGLSRHDEGLQGCDVSRGPPPHQRAFPALFHLILLWTTITLFATDTDVVCTNNHVEATMASTLVGSLAAGLLLPESHNRLCARRA
ncbi:hypothetical protein L249_4613, partial [Ophiocordyceps polyrhachis-furcata BCC 54312]